MFYDVSENGSDVIYVKEYEDAANHYTLLVSFGKSGPSIKVSIEQAEELCSALLREFGGD